MIAIAGTNAGSGGGAIAVLALDDQRIVSDTSWKALAGTPATPPAGWNTAAFDDSAWPAAFSAGQYGIAPWNQNVQTPATPNPSVIRVASVTGFQVGDRGRPSTSETRTITAVGTAGANGTGITLSAPLTIVHAQGASVRDLDRPGTGVTFTPALSQAYAAGRHGLHARHRHHVHAGAGRGARVRRPPSPARATRWPRSTRAPGAQVTPRLIGRLEITYTDGSSETIVTNRDWRAAFSAAVTDHWFGGTDYDARREPAGRRATSPTRRSAGTGRTSGWRSAGIAPPPNLTTKLAARTAEPVKVQQTFTPVKLTNPQPGVWVFDFGQNFAGWPELRLPGGIPAGTVVKMLPARDAERQRHRQPGLDRRRRPRLGHLRHLHDARRAGRRDVAAEVQLLRDAVPAGHRPARRASRRPRT